MPIRTNRGRAAVYRPLWGWPLRSPRHLVATLVGVGVLAFAVAVLTQRAGGAPAHTSADTGIFATSTALPGTLAPAASSAGPTASASPSITATRLAGPLDTPSAAPASLLAIAVIRGWAQRWVNHPVGMTNQQWLDQLRPYTTAEFLPVMGSINVDNIAATQVTGAPQVTRSYAGSVEALVTTNAGKLDITAIDTPQGWLVATYTEAA